MRRRANEGRFAERSVRGVDEDGREERITIWIERKAGGVWAVGRAVNVHLRSTDEPRADDYLFEGFELDDCLEAANGCLQDDEQVSEQDGQRERVPDFTREEILKPLERWFFGRSG